MTVSTTGDRRSMRAMTVRPGQTDSVSVEEVADPKRADDELLVQGLALGICGTDREIAEGQYGTAPEGRDRLVLGHESLGRVLEAPPRSGFGTGDLVAGIVRRPDPVPCGACASGEWDMCRNGRYRERGIKELDGYGSERWTVPADFAVRLDPSLGLLGVLMEPTSVVAKAWEQVEKVGGRSWFEPERVLVTGAGPIGLLAALLGAQRGLEVHVLDREAGGPKPDLVRRLGGTYHHEDVDEAMVAVRPDIVVEATGAASVVFAALGGTASYGVVCLTGVSPVGRRATIDGGAINREVVLENDAVVGSVNANRRHYDQAADALARADPEWLRALISRVVPLDHHREALKRSGGDIKVVLALAEEVQDW